MRVLARWHTVGPGAREQQEGDGVVEDRVRAERLFPPTQTVKNLYLLK